MSRMANHVFSPPSKNHRHIGRWESNSESSEENTKNIIASGSQTYSLDSPGITRRDRKSTGNKDMDHRGRHSVHILDKALEIVDKIFRPRHKRSESPKEEKIMFTTHRPMTMIYTREDDVNEFAFPTHKKDKSGSSSRGIGCKREHDSELSGMGAWPKCGVRNPDIEFPLKSVIPPLPPARTMPSYKAVRHISQNSDSTTTYSSHPPSPISSPQPSNKNIYFPKSSIPTKHSFNSQNSPTYHHTYKHRQSHHNQSARVHNTINPPKMSPIPSNVNPKSSQIEPITEHSVHSRSRRKPPLSRDQNISNLLHPSSHRMEYGQTQQYNSRAKISALWTPRPSNFTDRPTWGRYYHVPSTIASSALISPNYPTPSMPVKANTHIVQKATLVPIPHHGFFPDSITDLERLPPYNNSDLSSRSPSNISSSIERRFTLTPVDNYQHYPHTSLSRSHQEVSIIPKRNYSEKPNRIRIPSLPSVITIDTSGSVEVVSDRSSPCSPFPDGITDKMIQSTSPVMEPSLYTKRPQPGETRSIKIKKNSNLVGFQIEMGPSGGIFVSSVNENSLAAQAGLVIGDKLLEICAINMRRATYDLAARVLQQCGNNLTMLVQYNPERGESSRRAQYLPSMG